MKDLTLGSLFDGIAGFPLSASRYGITTKWASEIEVFPIKVSSEHFPDMKHLGDVSKVNGAEVEPVDIISFGSPCQDMSVAGKREGLGGARSGLFMEAVRIIKEMRIATNGMYPRFAIWENVPGAFSSNNGHDFRAVLEEIAEAEISIPKSGRWAEAGMVGGNGRSVAWRVLDAQYWGVPQRRKRIFLVADFGGECAGEILFEREGLSGHTAESGEAREEVTASVGDGIKATSRINCERGGISGTVSSKWAKGTGGPAGDEHYNLICQEEITVNFEQTSDRITINPKTSVTLKAGGGGGGAKTGLYLLPIAFNGRQDPVSGLIAEALDTCHPQAQCVAYPDPANTLLAKGNLSYRGDVDTLVTAVDVRNLNETEELSGTLQSKNSGGYSLNYQNPVRIGYRVRRLTPTECLRLQGFPDNWLDIEGASDSGKYKAVGNSVAEPCPDFIFDRIVKVLRR